MKLQLMNSKQFFITLPNTLLRAMGWQKGDNIKITIDKKGNLILNKAK